MDCSQTTISLIVASIVILILWLKHCYAFWETRGISTPPFLYFWGNLRDVILQKRSIGLATAEFYHYFKSKGLRHGGVYSYFWPLYVPVDINIVKSILQNDFDHFSSRGYYSNEKDDPLSAHLASLDGDRWKHLRAKLTPAFTTGKCKMMFDVVLNCTIALDEVLKNSEGVPLAMMDIASRYTTDVIGNCAFGIECNTLKEPDSDFRVKGDAFFHLTLSENITLYFAENIPHIMNMFRVRINRPDVSDFFMNLVRETIAYREKNDITRKDFMHLLIQLKNKGNLEDDGKVIHDNKLTFEEICAQVFIFFLAAYETSATTISFVMFALATHPEIQDEVRSEILEIISKYDGKITYEAITEMVYLDKVVNETMRLYPAVPMYNRTCTKDYLVPGTDLLLKKGQRVYIPVLGIHRDPEYYPEPEKFDPERFSDENKRSRNSFTFLPFGDGPRGCLGMRFGLMQTKVGLVALLRKHKFFLNNKTKIPLEFDISHITLTAKGDIWLDHEIIESH